MAAASALTYRYPAPSRCLLDGARAYVGLATSGGETPHPRFFDGLVDRPRQTAQAMLLVARVARSRFFEPGLSAGLERGHPRLADARALVDGGAVALDGSGAAVRTDRAVHRVRFADPAATCTCPWFAKHGGERGPCKHVLAATVARASSGRPETAWPAPS